MPPGTLPTPGLLTDNLVGTYLREIGRVPSINSVKEMWLAMRISAPQYMMTLLSPPQAREQAIRIWREQLAQFKAEPHSLSRPVLPPQELDDQAMVAVLLEQLGTEWTLLVQVCERMGKRISSLLYVVALDIVANAYDAFVQGWEELARLCDRLRVSMPDLLSILHDIANLGQDSEQTAHLTRYVDAVIAGGKEKDDERRKRLRGHLFTLYRTLYMIPSRTLDHLQAEYAKTGNLIARQTFLTRMVSIDEAA